ncbi:MAG TPA: M28 family metallopeptidase [Thermoanaerobaculia bacterium]|nr:M28 family metallopeptidase [Thermoanaerobaculia bacterium]
MNANLTKRFLPVKLAVAAWLTAALLAGQDPAEPPEERIPSKSLPPPAGAIPRKSVDEKALRTTVEELAACGTRHSLSSWEDPKRGIGCGRDRIVTRLTQIARESRGRLSVTVDRFEATAPRTREKPARLENVLAFLPGSDPKLAKTVFLVSGHFDSMPSSVMDPEADAPGADDDASGTAVSIECARLLSKGSYRATLLFAAVSGEEQGLLGGKRLLEYLKEKGYQIGGFLNNDIVGADFAPGGPHRVRIFSGGGPDGVDSPSRDLARAVEEAAGRDSVRLVFRLDRLGRGGDHRPFVEAGLPAVRLTEPLENYDHEHQTPRVESGREYGDLVKFLNFEFLGNVARANAETLRQLALAPAAPRDVTVSGGVTPDARVAWSAEEDGEREGFEILWRETTNPRWSVYDFVVSAGENALKGVSTDNRFFAVRSVGRNGARSIPVVAVLRPPPPR